MTSSKFWIRMDLHTIFEYLILLFEPLDFISILLFFYRNFQWDCNRYRECILIVILIILIITVTKSWLPLLSHPDLWTAKLLPRNWSRPCNWTNPNTVSVTPKSSSEPVLWENLRICVTSVCQRSSPSSRLSARVISCESSTRKCAINGKKRWLLHVFFHSLYITYKRNMLLWTLDNIPSILNTFNNLHVYQT